MRILIRPLRLYANGKWRQIRFRSHRTNSGRRIIMLEYDVWPMPSATTNMYSWRMPVRPLRKPYVV